MYSAVASHPDPKAAPSAPTAQLPRKAEPKAGESLYSLMLRLSEGNKLPRPGWLFAALRVQHPGWPLSADQIDHLSRLSGISSPRLAALQPKPDDEGAWTLLGQSLGFAALEFQFTRFCPKCLADAGYHRQIWLLRSLTCCPIHELEIRSTCPTCDTPVDWSRPSLLRCRKGHLLTRLSGSEAAPTDVSAARAIYEMFSIDHAGGSRLLTHPALQAIAYSDFDLLTRILAELTACAADERYRPTLQGGPSKQIATALPIMADWPAAARKLFRSLRNRESQTSSTSLFDRRVQKWLRSTLARNAGSGLTLLLAPLIRDFARSEGVTLMPGSFGDRFEPREETIGAVEAARLMRVSLPTLGKIARTEGWEGAEQLGGGRRPQLLRDVHRWTSKNESPILVREAAKILKISSETIVMLVERGVFGADARMRSRGRGNTRYFLLEDEIASFLTRLTTLSTPAPKGEAIGAWSRFCNLAAIRPLRVADAIEAAFAGRVRIAGWHEPIVGSLLFYGRDLEAEALRASGGDVSLRPITPDECTRLFNLSSKHFQRALTLGLFNDPPSRSGAQRPTISDVEKFKANYTTISWVAAELAVTPAKAGRLIAAAGITPVGKNEGPYPDAKIFLRKETQILG